MKDYKEKYEMALETIQEILDSGSDSINISRLKLRLQSVFPELKESTDEGIRESIAGFLKTISSLKDGQTVSNEDFDTKVILEWVAWLKKQSTSNPYSGVSFKFNGHTWGMCARDNGVEILVDGEIKERVFLDNETNKVAPIFHEGDWVVSKYSDSVHQIKSCVPINLKYGYNLTDGDYISSDVVNNYRLWTIEDAKDGDVLYSPGHNLLWIYKDKNTCYICTNLNYTHYTSIGTNIIIPSDVCPATKDEQTILFKKMNEVCYKWDADEKKIIKL